MLLRSTALAVTLLTACPAFATVTVDQSNVNTFSGTPGNAFGVSAVTSAVNAPTTQRWQTQTIVAGQSGKLTAIDLQAYFVSNNGGLLVTLGNGEITTAGYSAVGTITLPRSAIASSATVLAGGFTTVDLSSFNYFVTAGQTFTITLAASTPIVGQGASTVGWVFGELNSTGDIISQANYAPGVARISTDSGQTWTVAGADRGFRTYIDLLAVPEPATWGMMILGLGMAGAAMRRRSITVAYAT